MANRYRTLFLLFCGSLPQLSHAEAIFERKLEDALGTDLRDLPRFQVNTEDIAPKVDRTPPNSADADAEIVFEINVRNGFGADLRDLPSLQVDAEDIAPKVDRTLPKSVNAENLKVRMIEQSLAPNLENLPKFSLDPKETKFSLDNPPRLGIAQSKSVDSDEQEPHSSPAAQPPIAPWLIAGVLLVAILLLLLKTRKAKVSVLNGTDLSI